MASAAKTRNIDALMEQASQALSKTQYFEAERLCLRALETARAASDFAQMARIALPLQEARRQRLQEALDAVDAPTIVDDPVSEDDPVETGCYLVQPPQVGADARRLRLRALDEEVPVAVLCREPLTQLRLCPLVAISPGVTVRAKVDPPDDPEHPDMAWFVASLEALGDEAIDTLDPALAPVKRVDALVQRLDAIPEHEGLHQALEEACLEAQRELDETGGSTKRRRK